MLGTILVTMLQLVAGEPVAPPATPGVTTEQTAEQTTPAEATDQARAEQAPQTVQRCRREAVTGSNMRRRVCRTVAEEQQQRESAQQALDRARGVGTNPTGGLQ